MGQYSNPDARVSFLNSDFRAVRYDSIGKYNIYLFDGPHERQDQYDGLAMAREALDDRFIFIVDDWNWPDVRSGTLDAIRDAGWKIEFDVQVRSTTNDAHPGLQGLPVDQDSDWHNGYFVGVLSR